MTCPLAAWHLAPARRRLTTAAAAVWRRGLAWPRLSAWLELVTIAAGYAAYALIRAGLPAGRRTAFAHAAQLWRTEGWLHVRIEPYLNHLTAAHPLLADATGYYYGLPHFVITPVVLAWLYLRRPAAFGRLRSALVLATSGALAAFWLWPLAPPRFAVPGMDDILVSHNILGAASPHGVTGLVDLYAAMPSLHVAWATWCAVAVVTAARGRWRHLAWLYPAATTFVVLASANHFVLDVGAGAAIITLGLMAAGGNTARRLAGLRGTGPQPDAGPGPALPDRDSGVAPRTPVTSPRREGIMRGQQTQVLPAETPSAEAKAGMATLARIAARITAPPCHSGSEASRTRGFPAGG